MKDFFYTLKTNQTFKTKVLRTTIFLCLFIVGISIFAFHSNDESEPGKINEVKNMISGNYIPGDSIGIAMNKEEIYVLEESSLSNKEISLGKSMVEKKFEQQNNDHILDEYIKNRKESLTKIQSTDNTINSEKTRYDKPQKNVKNASSTYKPKRHRTEISTREVNNNNSQDGYVSNLEKRRILLQTGKRFSENSKNIKVNIEGNQTIKSGQYIRLKTMEDSVIKNVFVPKYTPIMASVGFGENRLIMNVTSIRINSKIINCNFDVYGMDGMLGLSVNLDTDTPGIEHDVANEVGYEVSEVVSRTRVGRIASNIFRTKKRSTKKPVRVLNNTNLMLVQN